MGPQLPEINHAVISCLETFDRLAAGIIAQHSAIRGGGGQLWMASPSSNYHTAGGLAPVSGKLFFNDWDATR